MKFHYPTYRTPRSGGFSLVEVTIAMAIAAVAIITLLGLIPQGMKTMQEAGDQAIEARIHQSILSEIQLTPFESVSGGGSPIRKFDNTERFYDTQGEEIESSRRGELEHIYSARIRIPDPGDELPVSVGGEKYNGVDFGGGVNENLRLVVIEVAAVGGRDSGNNTFDWSSDANLSLISTYQTMVAKMGQDYTN